MTLLLWCIVSQNFAIFAVFNPLIHGFLVITAIKMLSLGTGRTSTFRRSEDRIVTVGQKSFGSYFVDFGHFDPIVDQLPGFSMKIACWLFFLVWADKNVDPIKKIGLTSPIIAPPGTHRPVNRADHVRANLQYDLLFAYVDCQRLSSFLHPEVSILYLLIQGSKRIISVWFRTIASLNRSACLCRDTLPPLRN